MLPIPYQLDAHLKVKNINSALKQHSVEQEKMQLESKS